MTSVFLKHATAALVAAPLLFVALVASPAEAQEASRWTFTAIVGTTNRGPADDVHAQFMDLEFEHNSVCTEYPCPGEMTETGFGASGYPFLLEFRFAALPWAGVGLLAGKTEIGRTNGFNQQAQYLRLRYEADIIAPMVWVSAMNMVRLGAGPARYTARMTREDYAQISEDYAETVWGPVFEGALSLPLRGPVRFESRAQYRPVGEIDYGPYSVGRFSPAQIYPQATADFSHWFFGAGLSVGL